MLNIEFWVDNFSVLWIYHYLLTSIACEIYIGCWEVNPQLYCCSLCYESYFSLPTFKIIFFIFRFQQGDYDISKLGSLCICSTVILWPSWTHRWLFIKIRKFSAIHYFFFFFLSFHLLFSFWDSHYMYVDWLDIILQVSEVVFIFL